MQIVLIVLGVVAIYAGAILLWLRLTPARAWVWGPLLLITAGVAVLLIGAAGR
ncbi:phosphoethanolamine transferase CptA [Geodermatophilus sp. YIM 151500]|uniref:phosphoethanolamine transferase CptA n=1 Tax=Geodermatophilus sp. YIM 151500 TaxID=2984531 RepID=UPI0021E4A908|nr:phosphoethanolamine transferase CptA [Geodermatophilus sp. YIM 151500]MCV2490859.1 phosphoethanolamine transferase CptA [Geodermatophilus sp. YIM 151500]